MFALIFGNKVVEISKNKFPVAKPLLWLECDDSVTTGDFYINNYFKKTDLSEEEQINLLKIQKIDQCKKYLLITDWQIIRLLDPTSNKPLKDGVFDNRTLARNAQIEISACTTLEELNAININFE